MFTISNEGDKMMTRQQTWNRDTAIEKMAGEFLDKYFYPTFHDKAIVNRYYDKYHQYGGIDVQINQTNFDEKCKVWGCLNEVLKNPGMECSLVNKAGYVSEGWFLNDSLSTDYYAIIGLSTSVNDPTELTASSQISAADVLWVNKIELKNYVKFQTSFDKIRSDAERLRIESDKIENDVNGFYAELPSILGYNKSKDGKYRTNYKHGLFWLTYSSRKHEKPVNLVIPRKTLLRFKKTRHWVVTKEKVERI